MNWKKIILMESFLEQVKLLLPVVGFDYFETTSKSTTNLIPVPDVLDLQDSPIFYMNKFNTDAYAQKINDNFVVLKDSIARNDYVDSFSTTYKSLREQLIKEGKLSYDNLRSKLIFTEDVSFNSPTAAAAIIGGGNLSGRVTFKIKNTEITYGEWDSIVELLKE